jgi:thiosulfate dehydrogenase (quinone) large subunit
MNPVPLLRLLQRPNFSVIWFVIRLYVGWQWLTAGWHKVHGPTSIGWMHAGVVNGKPVHVGDALLGFWRHAIAPSQGGTPQVGYAWYRDFLQFLVNHQVEHWFVYVIAVGEVLIGLSLLLGAFTAVAAGCGALMNFNYLLAGSASINPVLLVAELFLLLAWRSAGYIGLDRWLLPLLGTPWQSGRLFRRAGSANPVREAVRQRTQRHGRLAARLGQLRRRPPV